MGLGGHFILWPQTLSYTPGLSRFEIISDSTANAISSITSSVASAFGDSVASGVGASIVSSVGIANSDSIAFCSGFGIKSQEQASQENPYKFENDPNNIIGVYSAVIPLCRKRKYKLIQMEFIYQEHKYQREKYADKVVELVLEKMDQETPLEKPKSIKLENINAYKVNRHPRVSLTGIGMTYGKNNALQK